jgi:hypothetical protein
MVKQVLQIRWSVKPALLEKNIMLNYYRIALIHFPCIPNFY